MNETYLIWLKIARAQPKFNSDHLRRFSILILEKRSDRFTENEEFLSTHFSFALLGVKIRVRVWG